MMSPLGAGLGLVADRILGEPPRLHPVAGFGTAMGHVEGALWRDARSAGVAYAAVGVALGATTGWAMRSTTASVAICAAGRELRHVASEIGSCLHAGDLDLARERLPSLVGRDPTGLDASGISAAVIESLAENSVDAVVAPALWGAVAGPAGAAAYRATNTMDAMVGHHSERYEDFGWAAARLDDAANLIPARVFAGLVTWCAEGSRRPGVRAAIQRDAPNHPSPNAGVAEAAVAGALGIELGGSLRYGERVEDRPTLGRGPRPSVHHIDEAIALVDVVEKRLTAVLLSAGVARLAWRSRR